MTLPNSFSTTGASETQKNADLALYLLHYLEQKRDPHERIWRGERDIRTLHFTCHVLEALHRLGLKGVTDHLTEPAANWLLALPFDIPPEDIRAFRMFPIRFKALALLGKFDPARLSADLNALSEMLDPDTGWFQDPLLDLKPTLITMIWADTLLHLEAQGLADPALTSKRKQTLEAIAKGFEAWVKKAEQTLRNTEELTSEVIHRPGEITNTSDATYAFDLLSRTGHLPPDAPPAELAHQIFTITLQQRGAGSLNRSELLYCGIHLRNHFPDHAEARAVIEAFATEVRDRYANNEAQREPVSFHALVLRLLAAHHGDQLRYTILEKLWAQSRTVVEAQQKAEQQQLETEFVNLVRQSMHIYLTPPQRITGTRPRGEVYRIRFGLTTEATDEHGTPLSTPRDTLRLIVKKGPPEVLARAVQGYRNLPEPLQKLFARHADILQGDGSASGYLIMQDLADMQPLSEVLANLDRPVILPEERQKAIADVAKAVAATLTALHGYERRPSVVGHQLNVIYFTPMADCLERLCQPLAFPELKPWLDGPLEANGWVYKRLSRYLNQLFQFEGRLHPPTLGYAHGDCHSRNLMLDHGYTIAKFVDIDTFTYAEDYVVDYGLLFEDVAVYQSLPYGNERGRLEWDDIQTTRPGNPDNALDNWITYPPFPQQSEGVVMFQRELMGHLQEYAAGIEDADWQARLWLSIARGLLLLANRQTVTHSARPQRRASVPKMVNDVKVVQVAYTEAIRLLHELTDHLDPQQAAPLPELPFPGEHRPPPPKPEGLERGMIGALIDAIQHEWGEGVDAQPLPGNLALIDYFAINRFNPPYRRLFARIDARSDAQALYLACRPEQLQDPHHLGRASRQADLGMRVALNPDVPLDDIMALVKQVYQAVNA